MTHCARPVCKDSNIRADGPPHPFCPPGDGRGPAPPVLCMLGYGNLGALANDPRVNPRAWQDGNDVGVTHEQLQPNCAVSCPLPNGDCLVGPGPRPMEYHCPHLSTRYTFCSCLPA